MKKTAFAIILSALAVVIGCSPGTQSIDKPGPTGADTIPQQDDDPIKYRTGGKHLVKVEYEQTATELELKKRSANLIYNMISGMEDDGSLSFSDLKNAVGDYDPENSNVQTAQKMLFKLAEAVPMAETDNEQENIEPYTLDVASMLNELLKFATSTPITNGIHEIVYTYKTVNGKGEPTTASATLFLPRKSLFINSVPTLVMPHYGDFQRNLAPSYSVLKGFDYGIQKIEDLQYVATFLIELMARNGYAFIYPDGLGIGANHEAVPMATKISAYNVIDAILAAQEIVIDNDDTVWDKQNINLFSLSLGAYSALETAKVIQQEYSDLLKVKTTACVDGPYDISGIMMDAMLHNDNIQFYVPSLVFSFDNVFSAYEPDFSYTNTLRNDIPGFQEGYSGVYLNPDENDPVHATNRYLKTALGYDCKDETKALSQSFIDSIQCPTSNLQKYIRTCNAFYNWVPEMPVMFFHNPGDPTVIVDNVYKAMEEFNKAGCVTVDYTLFPEYLEQIYFHGGACVIGMFKAFKWIDKQVYGDRIVNQ